MGESIGARWIVQSVDHDRASQRLVSAAQQTYLATADPAGLCPYVPAGLAHGDQQTWRLRSEEHTSELQSLMRISYAVFCLKKKKQKIHSHNQHNTYKHTKCT